MSSICNHIFEVEDPNKPGYSLTEYDLYARLGLSIRKNLVSGSYEIFRIDTDEVVLSGTLQKVVNEANEMEGKRNTQIECRDSCPHCED